MITLILKPNAHGVDKNGHYETVDICDDGGSVWASVHIDLFHTYEFGKTKSNAVYDALRRGDELALNVGETIHAGSVPVAVAFMQDREAVQP